MAWSTNNLIKVVECSEAVKKALESIELPEGYGLDMMQIYLTHNKDTSLAHLTFNYSQQGKQWEENINLNVI